MAKNIFRYPERCYKRQQYQHRQQQQQQQQRQQQRLPTSHLITQCSSENSDEDEADDLPAGKMGACGLSSLIFKGIPSRPRPDR